MQYSGSGIEEDHSLACLVMAKLPQAGRVKTRLLASAEAPDGLNPEEAAAVAAAMLTCTVERLAARWPVTLAVSPDGCGDAMRQHLPAGRSVTILDQGEGTLGARIDRAWQQMPIDRPIAIFGIDTPDVPAMVLNSIPGALVDAAVLLGPTEDGGYWTLAARRYEPTLLTGIDWGGAGVYDQTRRRAEQSGLEFRALPLWPDVDFPEDLVRLCGRLRDGSGTESGARLPATVVPISEDGTRATAATAATDAAALHRLATVLNELAR